MQNLSIELNDALLELIDPPENWSQSLARITRQIAIENGKQIITLEWDVLPSKELRGNSRANRWQKGGAKNRLLDSTIGRLKEVGIDWHPVRRIRIIYTIYYCGKSIDRDNLGIAGKAIQDALILVGVIPDDNPDFVDDPILIYIRVPHRKDVRFVMEIVEQ